ncbi:hypothetical protein [Limnochorda pilosa]|uniref:EfeO-type cupredoxin-like domain-containing protein n=1 Tax=Limnochorda pilosa TaxID=1555112 RepID=A0A0K2SI28_LIMPI|nr:hypothetical protein [Limnochorda pilosa]BAS26667.1 hypothetical protein LIP_0810 [Limnochorda pilosa]
MTRTGILRWAAGAAAACALLALAGGGEVLAQEPITLDLTSYAFRPDPLVLEAGKAYRLTVTNSASEEHEMMVGQGMAGMDHGYTTNFFEDIDVFLDAGDVKVELGELEELELEGGAQVALEFTVPEEKRGTWELGCFVPGHYDLGMHAPLVVK